MSGDHFNLGLIGWPLEHSLSPVIHDAALQVSELQGDYRLYPIPPLPEGGEALKDLINELRAGELDGLNVTTPHKESVLSELASQTPMAQAVGAVNTVLREGKDLIGENTDVEGFRRDLTRMLSPGVGNALILGAGGVARAVAYGLGDNAWKVWVASRRLDQSIKLANSMAESCSLSILPISLEVDEIKPILSELSLIVNATPLGMAPNVELTPWPAELSFPHNAMVYDLVYVPRETVLVRSATRAGLRATTGLGMLVEQAALAFEKWTGREAPRQEMRRAAQSAQAQSDGSGG